MNAKLKDICRAAVMVIAFGILGGNSFAADDAGGMALSKALAQVRIFKGLTDAERDALKPAVLLRQGKTGERIIEQNKPLNRMFFVMDGKCEVWVTGKLITTLSGQLLFGEVEFLDNLPGSADVVLRQDADVIELNNAALNNLMETNPRIGHVIMREIAQITAQRLRAMDERESASAQKDNSEIDRVRLDFISAFNAGNAEAIGKLIDPDGVWMMPNEPPVSGFVNIKASYIKLFKNVKSKIDLKAGSAQSCGDWAFIDGSFSRADTLFPSGEIKNIYGHYLFILKKQPDGTWKIARDIWNEHVK